MSSTTGLELPIAWTTPQVNNPAFDISADQLNLTANRTLSITGDVDWQANKLTNLADPTLAQDAVTLAFLKLENLSDVINPLTPADADALIYNFGNSQFESVGFSGAFTIDNAGVATLTPASIDITDLADQTAGDILYWDALNAAALLPVATDGQVLTLASGLPIWADAGFDSPLTTAGDIMIYTTDNVRLPIGAEDNVLTVVSGLPAWSTPAQTGHTIQNEGVDVLPQRINLDFVGPLVAATDDGVDATTVTVSGGLNDLDDTTITTPAINQSLVYNGTFWVNQLLTKSQLPSSIAYEDEINTFTVNQIFSQGLQIGAGKAIDLNSGFVDNIDHLVLEVTSTPPTPFITDGTIYLADGSDFNSPDPLLQTQIDRGGNIEIKPIVTSETVFALNSFSNGMFTEETGTRIVTDGGIGVRVQIFKEADDTESFEVVLNGQIFTITSPDIPTSSNSLDLAVGDDVAPQRHKVWIQINGGVPTMTSSTLNFPTGIDFAVVGDFLLQSQASVLSDGPYFANSPDYEIKDADIRGHLAHINDRLVELDSAYLEGIVLTTVPAVEGGTAGEITFTSTEGEAYELHLETIEAFDVGAVGAITTVVNEGTQVSGEFTRVVNIGSDIVGLTCADGITVIGNNSRVNLVLYTVHQDTEPNATNYSINLPFSTYANDADAIADVSNFAIKNVSIGARGISLLVAEVVIKITGGGGTFEVIEVTDLRGQIPGAASSAGSGGGGASSLNDLSDVTIDTPAIDQILINDGAGQWLNQDNPAGILDEANAWLNYQDYSAILDPGAPASAATARFFVEIIEGNNTGLFTYLQRNGGLEKVRVA